MCCTPDMVHLFFKAKKQNISYYVIIFCAIPKKAKILKISDMTTLNSVQLNLVISKFTVPL